MKRNSLYAAMAVLIVTACSNSNQQPVTAENETKQQQSQLIFPLGPKASPEKFVGTAYVNELVPKSDSTAYAIGDVVFEPGARNNWHTHQVRQIMLVTDGKDGIRNVERPLYR